jgi:methylamine utilization protein MauE
MDEAVSVLVFVAAGLLVASGIAKLRDPGPASRALAEAGLPAGSLPARLLGGAEVVVGGGCLLVPGPAFHVALGVLYAAFAVFLILLMRRDGSASCGCLGTKEAPPTVLHAGLDLVAAAAGGAAAVLGSPSVLAAARATPWLGIPFLAGLVTAGLLAYATVTFLPNAMAAYRRPALSNGPAPGSRQ